MQAKRAIIVFTAALAALFANHSVEAGSSALGAVTNVLVLSQGGTNNAGVGFVYTSTAHTNPPPCHTTGARFAFDLGTPHGAAMFALALSHQLSGKALTVLGTNNCSAWPDTESVYFISN